MPKDEVKAFFEVPERYLNTRFHIRIRSLIIRELLDEGLKNAAILDLGCGNGALSLPFLSATNHLTLCDVSQHMLEIAEKSIPAACRGNVDLINANFLQQSFERPYDLVLIVGVLPYVEPVEQAFAKIQGLMKPGARCIVQFNDADRLLGLLMYTHMELRGRIGSRRRVRLNRLGRRKIVALAERHQMHLVREQRYSLILPGMGLLPDEWLFRYEKRVFQTPALARFGKDLMLMFEKQG